MTKMVYQYKDYYFEFSDDRILFSEGEFTNFIEGCREFIKEDKDNNKQARQELVGSKSK
jgi:hypothetical protein